MLGGRAVAVALAVLLLAPTPARAARPAPGETRSHYLTTVDTGVLRKTGTADALAATTEGLTAAMVVLDAGSPAGDDGSVRLPDTRLHTLPTAVAKAVEAYGKAWLAAKGPPLVLVLGTTNYGQYAGGPHGAAWARMVEVVAQALPTIDVRGGLDAEQEYNTPLATRSWVEAYDASGSRPYVDFGSCTCPPLPAQPANHWTTEDVYAVAVGDGRAVVLPEIYATKGGNARAWARVVAWSKQNHPDVPIHVVGALTEAAACLGRSCNGIDLAPGPAWQQLATALTDPSDLTYSSDISYLPSPGRRAHGGSARRSWLVSSCWSPRWPRPRATAGGGCADRAAAPAGTDGARPVRRDRAGGVRRRATRRAPWGRSRAGTGRGSARWRRARPAPA